MSTTISNDEILKLWHSVLFSGSFSGIKTFQTCLKLEKDIDVSEARLYSILKKDSIFIIHQKRQKELDRRHLDLNNYGELVFGDLALMYPFEEYRYFLLVVDGFSSKVFVRPLKSKKSIVVSKALRDIFEEFNAQIYVFETDRGTEFQGPCKQLFKEKHIIYVSKYGRNKAFLSESYIRIVKRRLYMTLRGTLNQNWVQVLEQVVINLNNTPIKKLGYLKPNMIKNESDSVLVREAKTALKVKTFKEPDYKTQQENQIKFQSSKSELQKGNFCYVDFDEKLFDKSFDVVRGQILQISSVLAQVKPPLFTLVDLQGDKFGAYFYSWQLTPTDKPDYKKDFFLVEEILGEKTVKGQKYFKVKYLYYPSKFNEWVPATNITTTL